jgi:hypothetical protein
MRERVSDGILPEMTALKAHVKDGRIIVDETTDLPDGEIYVLPIDRAADLDDPELMRELEASVAEARAGKLMPASEVLAELRSRS